MELYENPRSEASTNIYEEPHCPASSANDGGTPLVPSAACVRAESSARQERENQSERLLPPEDCATSFMIEAVPTRSMDNGKINPVTASRKGKPIQYLCLIITVVVLLVTLIAAAGYLGHLVSRVAILEQSMELNNANYQPQRLEHHDELQTSQLDLLAKRIELLNSSFERLLDEEVKQMRSTISGRLENITYTIDKELSFMKECINSSDFKLEDLQRTVFNITNATETIFHNASSLRDDIQNTQLELIANISALEAKLSGLFNNTMEAHATRQGQEVVQIRSNISERLDNITYTMDREISFMKEHINSSDYNLEDLQKTVFNITNVTETFFHQTSSLRDDMRNTQLELIANISILEEKFSELHNNTLEAHAIHQDCQSVWETGQREAGVYSLSPPGVQNFTAWCEFDNSHGWTVIQRRFDGSQDFFLYWSDYKNGFGNIRGEYWLGNDNIYALTRQNRQLSIFLQKYDGHTATANYSTFYISSEENNYKLTISGYSGDADDALAGGTGRNHNGSSFSTRDRDNDRASYNCAAEFTGAWWYHKCHDSNLNGLWTNSTRGDWGNIAWEGSWRGGYTAPIHRTTMRITRN